MPDRSTHLRETVSDRRVHARHGNVEIVRYDRAGKWWLESIDGRWPRRRVSVTMAAIHAHDFLQDGGEVFFGLHGGAMFDSKVRGCV
jgi:hypothetical protein